MYDPLVDHSIPSQFTTPDSFWASNRTISAYPVLNGHCETEVAIVGAGYTGLSAAYHLRKHYGVDCALLEANQPGWGCSGRNGGFVLPGTGRLSIETIVKRWGDEIGQQVFNEFQISIQTVEDFIQLGIDCERTAGGYLKLAHKPALVETLHRQATGLSSTFGERIIALDKDDIAQHYLAGTPSYGGVFYPNAFSVNPWLLTQGIARLSKQHGGQLFGNSPVIRSHFDGHHHLLTTPSGSLRAKTLIIATNGYTPNKLFPILHNRTFPVISSIIVTEPLNPNQLAALGMRSGLMVMDTRPLKYYYRILPDNRLLFGGRGAIQGKHANKHRYKKALQQGLLSTFPQLGDVAIDHFWSGWVAVSFDDYPRLVHQRKSNTLYSAGYCGAGLAFSLQAGKRLAQLLVEPDKLPDLPYWQSPLKPFPLAGLRRPALQGFYWLEALKRLWS